MRALSACACMVLCVAAAACTELKDDEPGAAPADASSDAQGGRGGSRASDASTPLDAGRDAGTRGLDAGPDGASALATLGEACARAGARSCGGHASKDQLVCVEQRWALLGTCGDDSNCDSTAGSMTTGTCQPIVPECAGKAAADTACREGERFECGPDLVTRVAVETCAGGCAGGACSECRPGDLRCDRLTPQRCDDSGSFRDDGAPCPFVCSAGACAGECTPRSTRCEPTTLTPQLCDDQGAWQDQPACADVCNDGTCGACEPGTRRCNGRSPQLCDGAGRWGNDGAICERVCHEPTGTCADCAAPESQCSTDNAVQSCDDGGRWQSAPACDDQTCVESGSGAACAGECAPGQQRCSNNRVQGCAAGGTWSNAAGNCTIQGRTCVQTGATAACAGECGPGQTMCTDTLSSSCSDGGTWTAGAVVVGQCGAVCMPGATLCTSGQYQQCQGSGLWGPAEFVAGQCGAQCVPGAEDCMGSLHRACDGNAQWGTPQLTLGKCGVVCIPPQKQCMEDIVQTCNANGRWDNDPTCSGSRPVCYAGACTAPSCDGLAMDCGLAATDSCCASPLIAGGMFSQSTDGSTKATVSSYRLDKYEVTVARFRKFVAAVSAGWLPAAGAGKHGHVASGAGLLSGAGPAREPGWDSAWNTNLPTTGWSNSMHLGCDLQFNTWSSTPLAARERLPINCVNWYQAYAFCIWDGGFLPSAAEWGYAAAGGNAQRTYAWGSNDPGPNYDLVIYGCYYPDKDGSCGDRVSIAPVGSAPGGDGLFGQSDLMGNMEEWNLDTNATPFTTPCNDCIELAGSARMSRGAAFNHSLSVGMTSLYRGGVTPTLRGVNVGFRCARAP